MPQRHACWHSAPCKVTGYRGLVSFIGIGAVIRVPEQMLHQLPALFQQVCGTVNFSADTMGRCQHDKGVSIGHGPRILDVCIVSLPAEMAGQVLPDCGHLVVAAQIGKPMCCPVPMPVFAVMQKGAGIVENKACAADQMPCGIIIDRTIIKKMVEKPSSGSRARGA